MLPSPTMSPTLSFAKFIIHFIVKEYSRPFWILSLCDLSAVFSVAERSFLLNTMSGLLGHTFLVSSRAALSGFFFEPIFYYLKVLKAHSYALFFLTMLSFLGFHYYLYIKGTQIYSSLAQLFWATDQSTSASEGPCSEL